MKKKIVSLMLVSSFGLSAYAAELSKDNNEAQVESSTSHNPVTNTTTKTYTEKYKKAFKPRRGGKAVREDEVSVKEKVKDDGSGSSVEVKENHSVEQEKQ